MDWTKVKPGYEQGPPILAGAPVEMQDWGGFDFKDGGTVPSWEPPEKPKISVRERGKNKDTGKDRADRGKYRMDDHIRFQQYMKEQLQQKVRERQAGGGVGSTVLQEKRDKTAQLIAARPVIPQTAVEVVNWDEPPQTVYPDFTLSGKPYTRFDPGQEPLFDRGHDPRMRLEYQPSGPDYVTVGDPYVSFKESGQAPPGYRTFPGGKRPAPRMDKPQTTGSGSRNRFRDSMNLGPDPNVPSAEGMFDTSQILVREHGSGGKDGTYGNPKLRQQLIEKAQIEAREYTKVNQQFAAQEGQLLEQNRLAQAALAAKQAEFEAAKAEYASNTDTTSEQGQAALAKMNKMQTDGDALMTAYTEAQKNHATLQKQMADQHRALLDKDAAYGTLQGQLSAAMTEIEANKRALLDRTEIDQMKNQHANMQKAAEDHVVGLNKQIGDLNQRLADQVVAANKEGNEITRDYMKQKERAEDLEAKLKRLRQSNAGNMESFEEEKAEAAAQLKAASDLAQASDTALREMEQQYRNAMANREKLSASELLTIKGANEAKLAEVIAASNGANEAMKEQIAAINAQLREGGDRSERFGEQYNYTVDVLAELKTLLVQSVNYHETHVSAFQANTVITQASDARFDEIKAKIEEAAATQKPVVIEGMPSLYDIVEGVAGKLAADKAAEVVASGTGMQKNEGDMGSGTMTIVLVMVISFMLFWYFKKKKRR